MFVLGEKPNPTEIFKSASCPRLLTTLTNRDTMTTGSTTTSSENTTQSSDNHLRPTIEPMATENMDPSWNTPTNAETNQSYTAPPNIHGNTANYVASPTPMGTSNENRARPKAGRNLLGVSSSSSPFSPRFVTSVSCLAVTGCSCSVSYKTCVQSVSYVRQGWKMYRTMGPLVPENFGVPRKYFKFSFLK